MNTVSLDFSRFLEADRIVATTNLNRPLNTVTDAERIHAVVAVLQQHTGGWGVPEEGVPIANIRLNFYAGERLLGNLGLGRKFFALHHRGTFWSQAVAPEVTKELRALLDIELVPGRPAPK